MLQEQNVTLRPPVVRSMAEIVLFLGLSHDSSLAQISGVGALFLLEKQTPFANKVLVSDICSG